MTQDQKSESERRDTFRWRFTQLLNAGADKETAQVIAGRLDVSLHQAVDMLEHDCPPGLLVKILL